MAKNSFTSDPWDRPIPGQSWTDAQGSRPYDHPPKYSSPNEALMATFLEFSKPDKAKVIAAHLDAGGYADDLTKTVLMGGFTQGKWSYDTAALMAKPLLASVVAIGHRSGVKNINYTRPREKEEDRIITDIYKAHYSEDDTTGDVEQPTPTKDTRRVPGVMGGNKE